MKIPSESEIESAFHNLRTKTVSEKNWITYSQWTRFDPRLGEVWLTSFYKNWQKINPVFLQQQNLEADNPAVLGVLLDQCEAFLIEKSLCSLFRTWKKVAVNGVKPAPGEIFLIGLHPFASESLLNEMVYASEIYRRWGFGGKDMFINKFAEKQKTIQKSILGSATRREILGQLIKSQERITVSDYLLACEWRVSRRVAQKDLSESPKIIPRGKSRGRFYIKR